MISALFSVALAFAPHDAAVDLEPSRVYPENADEQGRWLASPAWRAFTAGEGAGWSARFDEATGTPRWMWGRGIPVSPDPYTAAEEIAALLDRHAVLLGFEQNTLSLRSVGAAGGTVYIEWDVLREGLPTWGGGISARVRHGNLVMLDVVTAPRAPVTGGFGISPEQAIRLAIAQGPAPDAEHLDPSAVPMLLERYETAGHVLRATWMVRTRTERTTASMPHRLVAFVDAETGELLNVHDEVRYAGPTGTVAAKHHERTVDGSPLVTSPLPLVLVESDGNVVTADENGDYTVGGNGPYTTVLAGEYVADLNNDAGPEGLITSDDPDLLWDSSEATQAEIDTYLFLNQVKDWGQTYAPEVVWTQGPIVGVVNINSVCNAFWDGNVNFFQSGSGCNNTGQIADVVYHEWGHGFHYYSLEAGFFDGSFSEGASDTVAFLITVDSEVGPYFFTNGAPVRNVAPNQVYPQDYVNSSSYVHSNGLIYGGAMWDLLQLLVDSEGEGTAVSTVSNIHAGVVKAGPTIAETFFEALVADDDDGDLDNGTPHVCELYEAFGDHGLGGSVSLGGILTAHDPVVKADEDEDVLVEVELLALDGGCIQANIDEGEVRYRVNGGDWDEVPLSNGPSGAEALIPGQDLGDIVEYYIEGTAQGEEFKTPAGGRQAPYSFLVGNAIDIWCEDFEENDGNFTVADGEEFEWGTPTGDPGDPAGAFSGTKIWGLDLGGRYTAGTYERLRTPKFDTDHYEGVLLTYRRWLSVEDSTYDQANIVVEGDPVWTNWSGDGTDHTQDAGWVLHVVDLQGKADQAEDVRIDWELTANDSVQLAGWNIDDVCVVAPATVNNRLGITDLEADVTGDTTVELTFTQPDHKSLAEIVIVRNFDDFPEDEDDGEVVFATDDVERGEEMSFEDTNYHPGTTYYAVFAGDGDEWLGWVEEDWNAVEVELVGDPEAEAAEGGGTGKKGCGCDGAGGAPWALGALVGLIGARRRR